MGENALNQEKIKESYIKQISKMGDSDFYLQSLEISENLLFLPVSKINELRRNLLDLLMAERLKNYKRPVQKKLKYCQFPEKEGGYILIFAQDKIYFLQKTYHKSEKLLHQMLLINLLHSKFLYGI